MIPLTVVTEFVALHCGKCNGVIDVKKVPCDHPDPPCIIGCFEPVGTHICTDPHRRD